MKVFKIIERLDKIIELLKEEKTGSAIDFAKKIGILRSMLFNYFEYLEAYEIDIRYDKRKNSYVISDSMHVEVIEPIQII
jgi:ACT domain-containing protein